MHEIKKERKREREREREKYGKCEIVCVIKKREIERQHNSFKT